MKKKIIDVEYEDGSVEQVRIRPKHTVAYEREFGDFDEKLEGTYRLVWMASASSKEFDAWLDTVADVDLENLVELDDGGDGGPATPERPSQQR